MYRNTSAVVLILLAASSIGRCYAQDIGLDTYTCQQFLVDAREPNNGERLLKSMMMVSWATGYAAAFQRNNPRADTTAIRLIAATLGIVCQKNPKQRVVDAISDQVKQLATAAQQRPHTPSSPAPSAVRISDFATYENFDLPHGDARKVRDVELRKCVALCKSDSACRAFSYDNWTKWCFLKSTVTQLTFDPTSTSGVRADLDKPQEATSAIRIEPLSSKRLKGQALRIASVHSTQECEKACEQEQACLGFTYSTSGERCELFSKVETVVHDNRVSSGYKTQASP